MMVFESGIFYWKTAKIIMKRISLNIFKIYTNLSVIYLDAKNYLYRYTQLKGVGNVYSASEARVKQTSISSGQSDWCNPLGAIWLGLQ